MNGLLMAHWPLLGFIVFIQMFLFDIKYEPKLWHSATCAFAVLKLLAFRLRHCFSLEDGQVKISLIFGI